MITMRKRLPRTISVCPPEIDDPIHYFCTRLSPTATPIYLPTNNAPGGAAGHCHDNVKRAMKKFGEEPCFGWPLWL